MKFFFWLHQHKLFVHYLTLTLVIMGLMSLSRMQKEARPNVDFNRVAVSVAYPGASPSDIEELVIDPIEEKLAEIDGIEEFRSVSFSGAGAITIKIDDRYPDSSEVVDEVRRRIVGLNELPLEANDPIITEIKAINIPVLQLALYGDLEPSQKKLEVEKLKDFIQKIPGVQSVNVNGITDLQLKVMADPEKLDFYDMTLVEILAQLQQWLRQKPGGLYQGPLKTANITVGRDYNTIEQMKNFVVRSNDSDQAVVLDDLSHIFFDLEDSPSESLYFDKPSTIMTIIKIPTADIIETVTNVEKALENYASQLPQALKLKIYRDEAKRVQNRLHSVSQNALFGLFLVLVLLIIFLDWRSGLVTSIGIPVAILGGLIIIFMAGSTLNSLVLIGLVVVLGMLVDDAIVVCENIYSYIEKGDPPEQAALKGTKEIMTPVIATVLTTIFAFFPILLMKGIMGQFISVIPMTVVAMLSVSLFEALLILPIHASELMVKKTKKETSLFTPLENIYRRYIKWSLKRKYLILGAFMLFFILSLFQGKTLFEGFTLFPAVGLQGAQIRMELPKNTPLEKTSKTLQELSRKLEEQSQGNFESLFSSIGQVSTGGVSGSRQSASHLGQITILFPSTDEFVEKEGEVMKSIRSRVKEFADQHSIKASVSIVRPGPPVGKPIQLQITSRDLKQGEEVMNQLKVKLQSIPGVNNLETDLDADHLKYRFKVDNHRAVSEGVRPTDISTTIFAASTGVVANEILKNNEKIEILLGLENSKAQEGEKGEQSQTGPGSLHNILDLKVRNRNGQAVPIRNYTEIIEEKGPSSIQRLDGLRTISLFGEVDEAVISGKQANKKIRPFINELVKSNPNVKIMAGGGERDRIEVLQDTMRLYVLALMLIFMVISLAFGSVLYPFLVLLTIPMGLCGVVWALSLHGMPLSLMAMIGVVGLSGVVVNISIILMKFMQEKVKAGVPYETAIIEAGVRRLRPIIITTLTTLIGLVPTMYGIGGMDTFVQPLALVLGWGLFVATLLSILVLPGIIAIVPLERKGPIS